MDGLTCAGPLPEWVGRAATRTLVAWLLAKPSCDVVRLSYHPDNTSAAALYGSIGFAPTGDLEDDEIVAEYRP